MARFNDKSQIRGVYFKSFQLIFMYKWIQKKKKVAENLSGPIIRACVIHFLIDRAIKPAIKWQDVVTVKKIGKSFHSHY